MEVSLKDIGTIITGNTPSKKDKKYWDSKDICFVKPDIIGDDIDSITNSNEYISNFASSKARIVKRNTILITCIGNIGRIGIVSKEKIAFNQQINAIIPNSKINLRYLAYVLLFSRPRLKALANAAVVPIVNKTQLESFKIEIDPELEHQDKIANTLDEIEKIKKIQNKEIEYLDTLIKARFVEMFGDPQGDHSKWKKSTIKECCTLKSGKTLSKDIENEGGNIPYVKVKDMNNRSNTTYITTSSRFVSNKTAGKGIFPIGTVIFPKRGGAIGTNKKRLTKVSICADLNIMGVVPDITKVNPQYLFAYFNTIDLRTLNNGSSIPQINNKDIDPLNINLPPLSLQNDFAAFVKQVDKSKVVNASIMKYIISIRFYLYFKENKEGAR